MSGRPLLMVTLPVLTVLAICLYLRRRGRSDSDPPEAPPPDQPQTAAEPTQQEAEPAAEPTQQKAEPAAQTQQKAEPAAESAQQKAEPAAEQTAGRDLGQVTAWVRDNIETRPEPEPVALRAEAAAVSAAPPEGAQEKAPEQKTPETGVLGAGGDAPRKLEDTLSQLEAAVQPTQTDQQDRGDVPDSGEQKREAPSAEQVPMTAQESENITEKTEIAKATTVTKNEAPVTSVETPVTSEHASVTSSEPPHAEKPQLQVTDAQPADATQESPSAVEETPTAPTEAPPSTPGPTSGAEGSESAVTGAEAGADTASENSSDSGKGGSSASLEQASPSSSPDSAPLQTTVYDFLIPQKLCGRLIGKNGTFVNMLKARTGAHVIIRLHPVKSSVKICSVDGTQTEIDACLKMIREKFPVNKFPAMTLEQLNRPTEQSLAVPESQQLHLPQGITCDVLVSAVVSAGQLFLQQHTHPTFRGLERLTTLMAACYADGSSTPELPRPVVASSICAAPVAGGWYRAQVVAFYPDTDEIDVRFMDYGGYSRIPAALARQIRTDFMSLPFQAEECYLANVMPVSEDGWSLEAGAVFESLITDRALEAMVVGYAEDGTPFVNLYSIQGTEYGNNAISLVNQQLVESGAARWVENQA